MSFPERQQLLSALMTLVIALFVAGGLPLSEIWRRRLRRAALAGFAAAVLFALIEIALWLGEPVR